MTHERYTRASVKLLANLLRTVVAEPSAPMDPVAGDIAGDLLLALAAKNADHEIDEVLTPLTGHASLVVHAPGHQPAAGHAGQSLRALLRLADEGAEPAELVVAANGLPERTLLRVGGGRCSLIFFSSDDRVHAQALQRWQDSARAQLAGSHGHGPAAAPADTSHATEPTGDLEAAATPASADADSADGADALDQLADRIVGPLSQQLSTALANGQAPLSAALDRQSLEALAHHVASRLRHELGQVPTPAEIATAVATVMPRAADIAHEMLAELERRMPED